MLLHSSALDKTSGSQIHSATVLHPDRQCQRPQWCKKSQPQRPALREAMARIEPHASRHTHTHTHTLSRNV